MREISLTGLLDSYELQCPSCNYVPGLLNELPPVDMLNKTKGAVLEYLNIVNKCSKHNVLIRIPVNVLSEAAQRVLPSIKPLSLIVSTH
jgi:hypothetical protein